MATEGLSSHYSAFQKEASQLRDASSLNARWPYSLKPLFQCSRVIATYSIRLMFTLLMRMFQSQLISVFSAMYAFSYGMEEKLTGLSIVSIAGIEKKFQGQ